MKMLLNPYFLSIVLGHFAIDFFSGQRSVVIVYLSDTMGMSNQTFGLVGMIFVLIGALMQPVFGYLADRKGTFWMMVGGLIWLGLFYAFGTFIPGTFGLVLYILSSLGSGMYHPAGTMRAGEFGLSRLNQETSATAYFFLFGQLGQFLGPLAAGLLLTQYATSSALSWMALLMLPIVIFVWLRNGKSALPEQAEKQKDEVVVQRTRIGVFAVAALIFIITFQSWAQQSMVLYVPKYLNDIGYKPDAYGAIASLFMAGSAFGNVLGGNFADRLGRRLVAVFLFFCASIPVLLIPMVNGLAWLFVLIPLAGVFSGGTQSILIVEGQHLIPGGKATASGLVLGFLFSAGAFGVWINGFLADAFGITIVFYLCTAMLLLASLLSFTLNKQ